MIFFAYSFLFFYNNEMGLSTLYIKFRRTNLNKNIAAGIANTNYQ